MTRRHPRARPPSPYATIPRGLSWYQQVAEYRKNGPWPGGPCRCKDCEQQRRDSHAPSIKEHR